jgi:hypothetical protein
MRLRHDLVLITWDDAGELGLGWVMDSEVKPKQMLVHTIGFVIARTRSHIVISSTVSEPFANHAQFQIPRKMIQTQQIIGKRGTEFPTAQKANDGNPENISE